MALTPEQCEPRVILKVLVGSHIHGLNTPTSDRDEDAIVVEPLSEAWGLGQPWEDTVMESPERDIKYFSLRKWVRMAANGNPNFLLMLFAPATHILRENARGSMLRDMRESFISKQAVRSHLGYMQAQRTRLINHQREFGAGGGHGKPRFELIEQFGYDTKFAMHLLRLGLQGLELATDGKISLPLPEKFREALMEVREGKWELPFIMQWAGDLEDRMRTALEASPLPDKPDYSTIEAWMQKTYIRAWSAERATQDMLEDQERWGVTH